jgi:hypothetical protein
MAPKAEKPEIRRQINELLGVPISQARDKTGSSSQGSAVDFSKLPK